MNIIRLFYLMLNHEYTEERFLFFLFRSGIWDTELHETRESCLTNAIITPTLFTNFNERGKYQRLSLSKVSARSLMKLTDSGFG